MKSKVEKILTNYNDFNQTSHKMTFNDYVDDKYNLVHTELFNRALDKYIEEKNIDRTKYQFIEIKQKNYYEPSIVCIKMLEYPYSVEKVSLSKYWDNYQFANDNKEINTEFLKEDFNISNSEIIAINYVTEKVTIKDKLTGKKLVKDLSFINSDIPFNKNEMTLSNTFGYKINNKIYGK